MVKNGFTLLVHSLLLSRRQPPPHVQFILMIWIDDVVQSINLVNTNCHFIFANSKPMYFFSAKNHRAPCHYAATLVKK